MENNFADTFLQEAETLLNEIEETALSLSSDAQGEEAVNQIFRAFHTIKGSGAMFGFQQVADFTHHFETLLDQVRDGLGLGSEDLSAIILTAADHIKLLIQADQGGASVDASAHAALVEKVRRLSAASQPPPAHIGKPLPPKAPALRNWRIRFKPELVILARGGSPLLLFRDLKKLGECLIHGHMDLLPPLSELQTEHCYLWWTVDLMSGCNESDIRDVFLFTDEGSELEIAELPADPVFVAGEPLVMAAEPETRVAAPQAVAAKEAMVRVPAERLDRLVSLVGELVINQSRLATAASRVHLPELSGPVEEIDRLISALRDDVLQIRMMSIGSIFGRFRRLVRDLSRELGKEIDLVTEGEETELDKSILDQLAEPLVHLLRNSIDHGIEPAEARLAKGKPRQGTIRLVALHRGSDVVVSIQDDGKGMDRAAIRAKAVAKQLIAPDANLSDSEILNLILLPGFSTAEHITSVSGRGVGMDVVKRQIDALRGTLTLASEPGHGSCVSLTLPLTLAIIEGLLVEAGDSQFIIPMAAVTETVELPYADRTRNNGRNIVAVRGELIPYVDLRDAFEMEGEFPPVSKIVLVEYEAQRVGLVVDRVMGTHQTVIQALGKAFRKIKVVSGSTITGDGRVALILDIASVVRFADCRSQDKMVA